MTDLTRKFVNTEGGLLIELEGLCSDEFANCRMLCRDGVVDSGSFTIVNACTMPITVTGFTVSDSGRFSLVEYPKYTGSGVYPSGEVPELPIPFTLKPRDKKRINTFFHPYYEELETGNAGTFTNRTGDRFGATVQIYPGFPILNCPGESDCDASVILTGEFICDDKEEDREWMKNEDNFITPGDLPEGVPMPPSDTDSGPPPSFACEGFSLSETHADNTEWQGANGSIDITVNAGTAPYTYSWSNGANTQDISNLSAGVYTLTVTDSSNCSAEISVTIDDVSTDPCAGFSLSAAHTNNTEWQGANGSIDITVNAGTAPYTYSWSNGANTQDISNLSAGVYTLTVTDANNCTASISVTIEDLAQQPPTNNYSLAAGNCGPITSASTGVTRSVIDITNNLAGPGDGPTFSIANQSYLHNIEGHKWIDWWSGSVYPNITWQLRAGPILTADINGCTPDQGGGDNFEQFRLHVVDYLNEGFRNGTITW